MIDYSRKAFVTGTVFLDMYKNRYTVLSRTACYVSVKCEMYGILTGTLRVNVVRMRIREGLWGEACELPTHQVLNSIAFE